MLQSKAIAGKTLKLAAAGGATFWVATVVFSALPIAAEYRRALSISYLPMLCQSLVAGVAISGCLSYFLLRFFERLPTKSPILKSLILSLAALGLSLVLVQVGVSRASSPLHMFVIGAALNAPRFLALGIVIGYLYDKLNRYAR